MSQQQPRLCPVCGSPVPDDAEVCPVCGASLAEGAEGGTAPSAPTPPLSEGRFPEITMSLPMALLFLAFFVALGAGAVYVVLSRTNRIVEPTPVPTDTPTMTPTLSPTPPPPTPTNTPIPTPTPLTYIVKKNDTCLSIALFFDVSVRSIVLLNNLDPNCTLYEGQKLLIPQPTPTPTPPPTATLSPAEATGTACSKVTYRVKANDTLSSIALNYNVPKEAIKEWNGLVNDVVFEDQVLIIPLCMRNPTPGPTPTPTPPPPYPPPELLLPPDGAVYDADSPVTLQWASVGELRPNEAYAVTVIDITADEERRLVAYVTDTKFVVPESFRHTEPKPHVYRWSVLPVRQEGTDEHGDPIWVPAGEVSETRTFVWQGLPAGPGPTATPAAP
ncbi:MAG: LysM peptidoglycan-binding domain-containing protein [Chloroflexi bacterium]|nr:LysM peptidoglycan-binding domain-containing protein [Chloroflexota bacterium]